VTTEPDRWNHNIHYHPLILAAVPAGCARALDVGCGEGMLAWELSRLGPRVLAIDRDEPSIALAKRHHADSGSGAGTAVEYVCGDFLDYDLEPASFDFIASVAALHHMDARAALGRMRELLRPGGTLAIVGCARGITLADLPFEAGGAVAHRLRLHQAGRAEKEIWLGSAQGLGWQAGEAAARAGLLDLAVAQAERGRAQLLAEELGLGTLDLARLSAASPELAGRYTAAAGRLRGLHAVARTERSALLLDARPGGRHG